MSKLGKVTTKATYGLLGIAMKPIYDQMRKERKEEVRRWNESLNRASQDVLAESMQPRKFEVHQPFDSIIHQHHLW